MANRCASLDTTWPQHLPAPAPALWSCPAWFSPAAAAFENDALASALAHASASPSSPTPSSSTTTTNSSASELSSLPYDVPPAHAQPVTCRPGPAGRSQAAPHSRGRVSKRKPRPSRRPPTTYISADPADFRRMVQEITGFSAPGAERAYPAATPRRPDPLAFVLPTLDTSACFMLDQAPPQQRWEDKTSGGAATGMAVAAAGAGAEDSSLLLMHELEAMMSAPGAASGFPTLESWGII
ncbi:hypothetical protein QYE76_052531 [Lolium multiflorum]|uniref:VQ domain-containing protein n=1 Tax=Lolium multiflorum TaxID=4521 RepID=A0AAD8WJ03_LOLMU|nr:hypothetical protein QYE76_052531 [Lolium multiflorum]